MYLRSLPSVIGAGDNKGKPNLIEITSAKMKDAQGNSVKFGDATYVDAKQVEHTGIPAESFRYVQFGDEPVKNEKGEYLELTEEQADKVIQEFIKDSGGAVRAAENIQDATKAASLKAGKDYIRLREDGEPSKIVAAGLEKCSSFSWAQAERVTNKSVRENAEKLAEDVDDLLATEEGRAELKKRMLAMFGKA